MALFNIGKASRLPPGNPPPPVNLVPLYALIHSLIQEVNTMSAALDTLKADVASLATEVAQAVAAIQADAAATANAAADNQTIADLTTQVVSLRDQLAAALAPATPPAA